MTATGQVQSGDYNDHSSSLNLPSCGWDDLEEVYHILEILQCFDTTAICYNLWNYYYDLGFLNCRIWGSTHEISHAEAAIRNYRRAYHADPGQVPTLFNLAAVYYLTDRCELGDRYMILYRKHVGRR